LRRWDQEPYWHRKNGDCLFWSAKIWGILYNFPDRDFELVSKIILCRFTLVFLGENFHQIFHNFFQSKLIEIYSLFAPNSNLFWMKGQMNTLYYFQSEMSLESMLRVHLQILNSWKSVLFFFIGMFDAESWMLILCEKGAKTWVKCH
jgi:hypothetical protein